MLLDVTSELNLADIEYDIYIKKMYKSAASFWFVNFLGSSEWTDNISKLQIFMHSA